MVVWDHAFAGGGLSACCLALRLTRDRLGSVLLIDDGAQPPRTFAFWTDRRLEVEELVEHEWRALRVADAGRTVVRPLGDWRYVIVRGDALRAHAHAAVIAAGGRVLTGHVDAVEDGADAATVVVDGVRHAALQVYDSRPPEDPIPGMRQTFHGGWIETDDDRFDPAVATLMDFQAPQEPGGVRFFHVLPVTPRRALVTGVTIAADPRTVDVDRYLREQLHLDRWRWLAHEGGQTPMTADVFPRRRGARVVTLGIPGGLLKASTGYAFTRVELDSERIARSLASPAGLRVETPSRWLWRWLDAVWLRWLAHRGPRASRVFVALFDRVPIDRVLRFLDERATLREVGEIVWALPGWVWFVVAVVRGR